MTHGFIYLTPQEEVIIVDLTQEHKEEARSMLEEMREMIQQEKMPEPTPVRSRCAECEYRNYCGDIL